MARHCCEAPTLTSHAQAKGFRDFLAFLRVPARSAGAADNEVVVRAPKTPDIWTLVTSRCRLEADVADPEQMKDGIGGHQLELRTLAMDSAVDLLQAEAGDVRVTDEQARQLANSCARNALILTVIGGLIAGESVTPDVRSSSP